jgi:iron complex outermembrane receptor protein
MNYRRQPSLFGRIWFPIVLLFSLAVLPARAQLAGTGTITGRVFNPATREYVRNAEIRHSGSAQVIYTEDDGSFRILNVTAGNVTVTVSYTGYPNVSDTVNLAPGATSIVNLELGGSSASTSGDTPVQLDTFVVSTERQGNAKSIMDQKRSMNVSNIVSAETFGNIAEGNIGEFMKHLPGIQLDYVEADARSPRIRGLPAQYTTVTYDGVKIASADAFIQNNGTDNGGGAGAGSRSFGFEQVSLSSVDSVEVNFTTNASQDADSPAGNINLRTRPTYNYERPLITFSVSGMMNSEQLTLKKTVRPDDKGEYLVRPNAQLSYANSFFKDGSGRNRLGISISLNESNSYNEQRQFVPLYDRTPTAADPRPLVITRLQYKDGPKFSERSSATFRMDYRITDNLRVSLQGILSYYDAFVGNRNFGLTTTRANLAGSDGVTGWTNVPITAVTYNMAYLSKRTQTHTYLPGFNYRRGNLEVSGTMVYSKSTNTYSGGESKSLPGNTTGGVTLPLTGLRATATRDPGDAYAWNIVQTGGADWGNLASYRAAPTAMPTFSIDGRFQKAIIYQGKLDAKYTTGWRLPTWFQVGGQMVEQTYIYRNPTAWQVWSYSGPGGGLGGSWAQYPSAFVFDPAHGASIKSLSGGSVAVQDHNTVGQLFADHPEYYTPAGTAANYLTAFVQQPKHVRERVTSLYAMFDTKPLPRLELQAGARFERTEDMLKDIDPLGSAQVIAAGYPVNAGTGVASTIPGIQYQYFTNPRKERTIRHDEVYPSGSLKYELSQNLLAVFGYSYTITRPSFSDLSGVYTENDATGTITAPNSNLKSQFANNYSTRLTYYFEPVGTLGVGVFENDFKNYQQQLTLPAGAADQFGYTDPLYDTYTITTKVNIPGTVVYRGMTAEYMQSLTFLPKPFNGLSVFANYTRTYTQVNGVDAAVLNAPAPYNYGWTPGVSPRVVNYGVNFSHSRFSIGIKAKWTDKTPTTSTYNTFMKENTKIDLDVSYSLTKNKSLSLFFYARNLFNVRDYVYANNNPQQIGGGRAIEYYGAYLYAGVRGRF